MRKLMLRFRRNESGAAMMEYALLAGLIALVAVGAVTTLGGKVNTKFEEIRLSLKCGSKGGYTTAGAAQHNAGETDTSNHVTAGACKTS